MFGIGTKFCILLFNTICVVASRYSLPRLVFIYTFKLIENAHYRFIVLPPTFIHSTKTRHADNKQSLA